MPAQATPVLYLNCAGSSSIDFLGALIEMIGKHGDEASNSHIHALAAVDHKMSLGIADYSDRKTLFYA